MEKVTIEYGGAPLDLIKIDDTIGVRTHPEWDAVSLAGIPTLSKAVDLGKRLGGFRLVRIAGGLSRTESVLDAARRESVVSVGTHVYQTSSDGVPFVPSGEIHVIFSDHSSLQERQELIDLHALEIVRSEEAGGLLFRTTPRSVNPVQVAAQLIQSDSVRLAEPNLVTLGRLLDFALPSDELLGKQWHLRNTGFNNGHPEGLLKGADAGVVEAWRLAQTLGDPSVVVAVIDNGFDLDHPELSANGKLVAPWDFARGDNLPLPESSFGPQQGHGTACAGVAVAASNGIGVVGAAPGCRLMPVRWNALDPCNVVSWFNYVTSQGASVVSCSWSARASNRPLCLRETHAISKCARQGRSGRGCVICFAAGNDSHDINDGEYVNGFAIHPDVMAIAACTSMDQKAPDSNFGERISLCAPSSGSGGRRITTVDLRGRFVDASGRERELGYSRGPYTDIFGGTSSSCPLVAGIAALVLSVRPELTAQQVRRKLEETARPIGPKESYRADGHSREFGYGCVSAERAVRSLLNGAT